ncbi:MAG TPA: DUF2079 domain-containing protein, partial [Polyangia bacterium]|nr:DUF2079 domain-containing protein [Polyangia bacterium]
AAFMGSGTFGAYLIGRKWLNGREGGVLAAWLYVLNPNVQCYCLHDIHANVLIIPALLLAVGFMEAGHTRIATAFAVLTALCREEAPVFAACIGLYWMLSGEERRRFGYGAAILVLSVALEIFFSAFVMRHFGGEPRLDHFNLFFDGRRSTGSMLGALALNPLGAAFASTSEIKLEYLAISLVWMGGLALVGWRAGWFALPAVLLLVPASDPGFFCLGMNYSAPLVPAALMMGLAGLRRLWTREAASREANRTNHLRVGAYVLATALLGNYLYGNIASKSYKLEYGQKPFRRENQRDYRDVLGYLDALPPFGAAEHALWDVIHRVPRGAPVLTTWSINPQLSDRDVALSFGYSGGHPAPEDRVRYVVIDKLPVFQLASEPHLLRFRNDPRWEVFYENLAGVIFERRSSR